MSDLRCQELDSCEIQGRSVRRFCFSNAAGVSVQVMEFGATVLEVSLTEQGIERPLTRGLAKPADYAQNVPYMGALCGRYAGRIGHARLQMQGQLVELTANSGEHHLHGGALGFSARHWCADPFLETHRVGVQFSYLSPAGEEGYPGQVDARVRYSLDARSRLHMEYSADVAGQATPINLTNHSYWNLATQSTVLDHELRLAANEVLEFDRGQIPTGRRREVHDTPFDFLQARPVGQQMAQLEPNALGFDHFFLLDQAREQTDPAHGLPRVALLRDPVSGRRMEVFTDQPGLVVYTGNYLDGTDDSGGHARHSALCLECQQFPDAPNQPSFPDTLVAPGEQYSQHTIYQFFSP